MKPRITITVMLAALLLGGCGTLARPSSPEVTRLHLDGAGADIPRAEAVDATLVVARPRALPAYASPRFAYMREHLQIEYYGRNEWSSDPSRMLQPAVVRALEQSGRFAAVVASPSPALADLRLDLEIITLLHDYRRGREAVALTVRAQLSESGTRRVVATRVFELRQPAGVGPVRGAVAADRALARFLEQLVEFCVEHTG